MRICFICNEYPPAPHGGVGTFVQGLARRLARLGHAVAVVGWSTGADLPEHAWEDGVEVWRLKPPRYGALTLRLGRYEITPALLVERVLVSRRAATIARAFGAQIVESYDWSGPLWRAPMRPLVVRMHGAHTAYEFYEGRRASRLLRFFERRNVAMADALAAVSRSIGEITLRALGLNGTPFRVIYNGVDTELFRPAPVERDPWEVLYVGSVTRRKGVPDLLAAFALVAREAPQAHLTIVGRLPASANGVNPVESWLRGLPESIRSRVVFTGPKPHAELPAYYSRAAVAVFPSRAEAFGLTCAEAMACGAAIVMTSLGSGPELVEDGSSGLLADPRKPVELAGAILRLLGDPALRKQCSEAARRRVLEKFDAALLTQENLRFYRAVLEAHRGG
jgi:glycosyltransferase involved in cell wall biosynthesis